MIEAGLRPELKQRRFRVFPTIRVGYEPPRSVPGVNRYRLSVLTSLEEARAPEEQLDPDELASIGLDDYLGRIGPDDRERDPCLIFDQFEELFTLDPADWDEKEEFLAELGDALADRSRWALFAMREDFVAQLDPYLSLLPTRFGTRYRLGLLGPEAAREAAQEPARSAGVDFTDAAAEHLVDDLRRIRVQRGVTTSDELGPNVEPVQLQVVCRQLWGNLGSEASRVRPDDVVTGGNVNQALASFYEDEVRAAASRTGAGEREIREWFEDELISADGFRTQVRQGPGKSGSEVVGVLEHAHLIRADRRRGTDWYELTHDRFVEPIRISNAAFRRKRRRRSTRWLVLGLALAAVVAVVLVAVVAISSGSATVAAEELAGDNASKVLDLAGNEVTRFRIDAAAGDEVTVELESTQSAELRLLRDEEGQPGAEVTRAVSEETRQTSDDLRRVFTADQRMMTQSESPAPLVLQHQMATGGSYFIEVTPKGAGTFAFTYSKVEGMPIPALATADPSSGALTTESQVDLFSFDGEAGEIVSIVLLPDEQFDGVLALEDDAGSEVAFADLRSAGDSEFIDVPLPASGTYSTMVSGFDGSTGGYELTMERPEVDVIAVDQPVSDVITEPGSDLYRFEAAAGEEVSVTATPDDDLDVVLTVTGPGAGAVTVDRGGAAEAEFFATTVSSDGTYVISVEGFLDTTGDYELEVRRPEVTEVSVDVPVSGAVEARGDAQAYRLEATAGDEVFVVVAPIADFDSVLLVSDPDGVTLTVDWGGPEEPELFAATSPSDGTYSFTVAGFADSTGDYELTVSRPEVAEVAADEPVSGAVEARGDADAYRFAAVAGEEVLVTVTSDDLDPVLLVTGPDGVPLTVDSPGDGQPEVYAATPPFDGEYSFTVTGFVDSTGDYEFAVSRPDVGSVPIAGPAFGVIDRSGQVDVHRVDVVVGEVVSVAVDPSDDFDPILMITAPDGFPTQVDEEGPGGLESFVDVAPSDGTYLISVRGFDGSTGDYELSASRSEIVDVVVDEPVSGAISVQSDINVFLFDGVEGESYVVTLVPTGDLVSIVSVADPDGFLFEAEPGIGGEQEVVVEAQLGGSYVILVAGVDGSAGDYDLLVTELSPTA